MLDSPEEWQRLLDEFYPYRERFETIRQMPAAGRSREEILADLRWMAEREDEMGFAGRMSGSVYHGDHEHYRFLVEAFGLFAHANVLQRDVYPSATKFEAEIVAMCLSMLHGEAAEDACGVLTSGGSESLITQMVTYRDAAAAERGVSEPEIIMPVTGHCSLDKGAHYFGIKLVYAPLRDDFKVDVDWVAEHVTPNTVALFGSAGNYPHGLIDDIPALGRIAQEHGIGLHVDGCLGGFILPWGERLGYDVPPFDFRVPGVTSMSVDPHKFGYGLKGTSVVLYASKHLRRYQFFTAPEWPGGTYISPGMSGSRSGGLIASTWAAMVSLGEKGYLEIAERVFATAAKLRDGVAATDGLAVIGDPLFNIAFTTTDPAELDIFHVNDFLAQRGWRLNGLQHPPAVHFCVTRPATQEGVVEQFLADLAEAVAYARAQEPGKARSGALYGLSGAGPEGVTMARTLLSGALDAFYEPAP
ncbi:MAG TPA: aspartate aminotransferase family protein [Kineosporiaceae bacterium]|nr:aspartate aminotransferase family protein [Kineosporiaceae bacterium]